MTRVAKARPARSRIPLIFAATLSVAITSRSTSSANPFPVSVDNPSFDEVVATIDGEAILASDLRLLLRAADGEMTPREALITLLFERALAKAAGAAKVPVADKDLERAMDSRVSTLGGWEKYRAYLAAADSTLEKDRLQVRDGLRAEQYVLHCLGLVPGSPHLRPDLARGIDPGPKEIQEFFRAHRADLAIPGVTRVGFLTARRSDFKNDGEARAALERHGRSGSLDEAPNRDSRLEYSRVELPTARRGNLAPAVGPFLDKAQIGDRSPVLTLDKALAIVEYASSEPARAMTFAEAQSKIQSKIRSERMEQARQKLAWELVRDANVWPESLIPQESSNLSPPGKHPTVAPGSGSH